MHKDTHEIDTCTNFCYIQMALKMQEQKARQQQLLGMYHTLSISAHSVAYLENYCYYLAHD